MHKHENLVDKNLVHNEGADSFLKVGNCNICIFILL